MSEVMEKAIRDRYPDAVVDTADVQGVLSVKLQASALVGVCEMLKGDLGFDYLMDIAAVDWKDRIEVVYQMMALANSNKLTLKVDIDREKPEVDTVTGVWNGANFMEREVFDLMGVVFKGHPDLRRILLPEDWEGYPLRKDYVNPD